MSVNPTLPAVIQLPTRCIWCNRQCHTPHGLREHERGCKYIGHALEGGTPT